MQQRIKETAIFSIAQKPESRAEVVTRDRPAGPRMTRLTDKTLESVIETIMESHRQGAPPIVPKGGVLIHPGEQAQKDVTALRKTVEELAASVSRLLTNMTQLAEKVDLLQQQVATRQDKFQLGSRRMFDP